jgi:transmembrane sensor
MLVLSRGEGMFRVHHDTDRPFSVCAATGCITAVGTVFDVRLYSNHVRVWVQQGAVDVTPQEGMALHEAVTPSSARWPPVRLAHGQEVSYDAKRGASSTQTADPLNAGAWTSGSLIYFGRPLGEVIEDVQRYSVRRIVIDQDAAIRLYSGSVVQQHIDQWIRGLSQVFPVEIIDCRALQESIGRDIAEVRSSCTSDPSRILIRSR